MYVGSQEVVCLSDLASSDSASTFSTIFSRVSGLAPGLAWLRGRPRSDLKSTLLCTVSCFLLIHVYAVPSRQATVDQKRPG